MSLVQKAAIERNNDVTVAAHDICYSIFTTKKYPEFAAKICESLMGKVIPALQHDLDNGIAPDVTCRETMKLYVHNLQHYSILIQTHDMVFSLRFDYLCLFCFSIFFYLTIIQL